MITDTTNGKFQNTDDKKLSDRITLKLLDGGLSETAADSRKVFQSAYVTDTRLMGKSFPKVARGHRLRCRYAMHCVEHDTHIRCRKPLVEVKPKDVRTACENRLHALDKIPFVRE